MFFYLSKIFGLFLNPLLWILGLFVFGLLTKNKKRKTVLLYLSLGMGIFFSNAFLASECARMWEIPLQKEPDTVQPYDIGIVIGGGLVQSDKSLDRLIFRNNTDRIFQAILLYKEKKIKKILLSSGSGHLVHRDWPEAQLVRDYFLRIGIPKEDILLDSLSKNTRENAVNSAAILKATGLKSPRILLITSTIHMKRAMACFAKAGISCVPYPTSPVVGPRHFDLNHILVPQPKSLLIFDELFHEMLGMLTYKIIAYV
jgi:uncharacterized SAM-binding protein YcdF (DUF218 family)